MKNHHEERCSADICDPSVRVEETWGSGPSRAEHGHVTAQFVGAQHSEKSFQRKKNVVSGLQGEYKVEI